MDFILHAADISNSAKNFNISSNWSEKIVEEFWNQV